MEKTPLKKKYRKKATFFSKVVSCSQKLKILNDIKRIVNISQAGLTKLHLTMFIPFYFIIHAK